MSGIFTQRKPSKNQDLSLMRSLLPHATHYFSDLQSHESKTRMNTRLWELARATSLVTLPTNLPASLWIRRKWSTLDQDSCVHEPSTSQVSELFACKNAELTKNVHESLDRLGKPQASKQTPTATDVHTAVPSAAAPIDALAGWCAVPRSRETISCGRSISVHRQTLLVHKADHDFLDVRL